MQKVTEGFTAQLNEITNSFECLKEEHVSVKETLQKSVFVIRYLIIGVVFLLILMTIIWFNYSSKLHQTKEKAEMDAKYADLKIQTFAEKLEKEISEKDQKALVEKYIKEASDK